MLLLAITIIIVLIDPFGVMGKVRDGARFVFVPLTKIGYGIGQRIDDLSSMVFDMGTLHHDNEELRKQVRILESSFARCDNVIDENEALREDLALLPRENFSLIGAEVVLRDSLGGDHWIVINRGQRDGVESDMAVIVDESVYVGYIDHVDYGTARVRLLTHPESVINVIGSRSEAEAIVRGDHGLAAVIEDIQKERNVEENEIFLTSRLGNRLPQGFAIGRTQHIATSEDQLFKKANIIPLADLGDLDIVFVVKSLL